MRIHSSQLGYSAIFFYFCARRFASGAGLYVIPRHSLTERGVRADVEHTRNTLYLSSPTPRYSPATLTPPFPTVSLCTWPHADPCVVVIGGWQNGIEPAARPNFLNVPVLVVEKHVRINNQRAKGYQCSYAGGSSHTGPVFATQSSTSTCPISFQGGVVSLTYQILKCLRISVPDLRLFHGNYPAEKVILLSRPGSPRLIRILAHELVSGVYIESLGLDVRL
jgi:hypothetical protein